MSLVPLHWKCLLKHAAAMLVCGLAGSGVFAAKITTRDGQSIDGSVQFRDEALWVALNGGSPITVPLTNLARAVLAPGPFLSSGSTLPNGWILNDSGDVRGSTRFMDGVFELRAEGQSTNATAFHSAGRSMHSDGEISARVERVSGGAGARAGVMIRAAHQSALALLSCDAEGRVWFERRPDSDKKEFRSTMLAKTRPPVWLRLHKREKTVTAMISHDGRLWERVGRDLIKLLPERVWREHEGESYQLKGAFGVFIANRSKGTVASARVADVAMEQDGLLGHYFADREFTRLAFTRLDPQVNYSWTAAPESLVDLRNFSVRWTGQLVPLRSGRFVFHFEGDETPRLWLDGREMDPRPFRKPDRRAEPLPPETPVTLNAGQPVGVTLEFKAGTERPFARLGWTVPGGKPEVLGMTNFAFRFTATNSPEPMLALLRTNDSPLMRGVLLRDGSFIASPVASANESAVKLSLAGRDAVPVLNTRVSRIYLRPPRQPLPYQLTTGRTGVFLRNGDFSESEFRGIEHGGLNMSSVLFGLRKYWIEGGDALAVVLNDCVPAPAHYEVRLVDGSILRTHEISLSPQLLKLREPLLGELAFPVTDLCEIRRLDEAGRNASIPLR